MARISEPTEVASGGFVQDPDEVHVTFRLGTIPLEVGTAKLSYSVRRRR
jgi:hypothetical protein